MSEKDTLSEGLQAPNSSTVQVLIEPATPTKQERDHVEVDALDNKTNEEPPHGSVEGNTSETVKADNDKVEQVISDVEVVSVNENNNEDSKDDIGGTEETPAAETSSGMEIHSENETEDTEAGSKDNVNDKIDSPVDIQENNSNHKDGSAQNEGILEDANVESEVIVNEPSQNGAADEASPDSTNAPDSDEKCEVQPDLAKESKEVEGKEPSGETVSQNDVSITENDQDRTAQESDVTMSKTEEEAIQITTDTATEDMEEIERNQKSREGSVGEMERTTKTPESITYSVDIPVNLPVPISPTKFINRPLTAESEFVYNEHDFATPDYEMYGPSPAIPEGVPRQLSPSKRERTIASRGESIKSVTFADDVGKGSERDEEEEGQNAEREEDEEKEKEEKEEEPPELDEAKEKEEGDKPPEDDSEEEEVTKEEAQDEALDIFPTAVSEEKIEEAKKKQQQEGFTRKESLAIELFGASKFVPETMVDVISNKAHQHFEVGCRLVDKGEYGPAVLSFDKALNLLPKEVKFYLMRGEAYLRLCDFQSAILNLKKACVLLPSNDEYYSRLAFVYYFQGQSLFDQCLFAEALESFSRAAEMKPGIIAYHTRSIACLAALQRHGECLALVNRRLETERSNPDLFIMRARLHQLFRNTTLCYYDLKDALALDPEQEEARTLMQQLERKAEENRNHATRLQLQGKFKDSLNKITIAIEMNPSISDYHLQRGALHRRLHDYNAAIDDFLLAMDKTEHNEHSDVYTNSQRQLLLTYNDFSVECFLGGHFEEAILLLNKALKGEKREKGLYVNRGDCFFRLQELHFALADYHQASELDPTDPGIRSRIAAIHGQFGLQDYEEHSYQDADARFTVAIQHNPKHGTYYIARCKVRLMMENLTGARQDFLMGLHLDPSNTDILTLMPRIYPGKSVGDVMRTKHAKEAKVAADNAVMTASPIRLPGLDSNGSGPEGGAGAGQGGKHVSFAPAGLQEDPNAIVPSLKYCMDEIEFNKILTKDKKKISNQVKSMLHDRGTLHKEKPKLLPVPPARPYELRGGHWKNPETTIKPGWRTFSLGVGLMD